MDKKKGKKGVKKNASGMVRKAKCGLKAVDPMFNDVFIRIFGREDSRIVTRGLVNALFLRAGIAELDEIDAISSEYTSSEGSVECRSARVDVRLVCAKRIVDIESQRYPQDIESKSLFYGSQLLVGGTPRGTDFADVPEVVVVTLLTDEVKFPESEDFVSVCRLRWSTSDGTDLESESKKMAFVLVELRKVRDRYTKLEDAVLEDRALAWAYLLTNGYRRRDELEAMMFDFPDIDEFAKMYGYALDDPEVVRAYNRAIDAEREYRSRQKYLAEQKRLAVERGTKEGIEQGIKKGIKKGVEQERRRFAAALRAKGVGESIIEECIPQ